LARRRPRAELRSTPERGGWLVPAFSGPPGSFSAVPEVVGRMPVAAVVAGCAAVATLVLGVAGGALPDIVTGTLAR
jgi:hypothetical protein